jgi:hypothetical protein
MRSNLNAKEIPTGIKLIASLYYILAGFSIVGAIFFLISLFNLDFFLSNEIITISNIGNNINPYLMVTLGITIFLALAIFCIFLGKKLKQGVNWVRILLIVFSSIGLISNLFDLINGTINLMIFINPLIIYYLGFNQNAKQFFSR